jgi:hypothetical protein
MEQFTFLEAMFGYKNPNHGWILPFEKHPKLDLFPGL